MLLKIFRRLLFIIPWRHSVHSFSPLLLHGWSEKGPHQWRPLVQKETCRRLRHQGEKKELGAQLPCVGYKPGAGSNTPALHTVSCFKLQDINRKFPLY